MSKPLDNASSAGQYAGSAIVFPRRTTAAQPERSTRKRHAAQPEPDHPQGHTFGIHPADDTYSSDSFELEGADYPDVPARPPTGAIRYARVPSRQRETARLQPKLTKVTTHRRVDRTTLVIWLCLAFIMMVGGWWLLSAVATWWQGVQDNLKYGTPRTFQVDQYVNLGDSPAHPDHFIALNLHGVIEVIQLNPSDQKRDGSYVLTNVGNESIPVTLSFQDVHGDGRMDMLVSVGDSTPYTIQLLNNGTTFQPTQPTH